MPRTWFVVVMWYDVLYYVLVNVESVLHTKGVGRGFTRWFDVFGQFTRPALDQRMQFFRMRLG